MALYHTLQWYRHNHLNPDISKDAWTHEEDLKLVEAHLVIQVFFLEEFFFKRKKIMLSDFFTVLHVDF